MATPPQDSGKKRSQILGRTRTGSFVVLIVLLALCLVGLWATRGAMQNLAFLRAKHGTGSQTLVDLSPWQTAQTLASLAVTSEEKEYAAEAERLADHEVDQAFASALRQANLQQRRRVLTGRALEISQRVAQLQQEIAQDQATVASLKASGGGSSSPRPGASAKSAVNSAASSDALQVAQAQLGLDQDELTDAQRALDRATGNESVKIQDELAAHEASMKKYDSEQQSRGVTAVVSARKHGTLYERIKAWLNQRGRHTSILVAQAEAQNDAKRITAEYNALEAKVNAKAAASTGASTLEQLEDRATERQVLSINQDRIQTDQQLASVYGKWANQVLLQHRIVLHLILQSLEIILLLALGMISGDELVRHLTERPSLDRRQAHTLRTILRVALQLIGVLLIVLVIFGPPQQTATMLGLGTAALTIALQDYILAFIGWFMLVGKNGIRVGDMVEINGVCGEVVEVGLMSTTLLETTGLAEKGEPTGRRMSLLNSYAIRGKYFNFSSDGQWMWDEITVSVPADNNIDKMAKSIEKLAREETADYARQAEQEWKHSARSTTLTRMSAAPFVMMRPSGSGVDIQLRYVTSAVGRYAVRDRLDRQLVKLLHERENAADSTPAQASEAAN